MPADKELLPCPFCGGKSFVSSTLEGDFYVMCEREDCFGMVGYTASAEQAVENWNTRPATKDAELSALRESTIDVTASLAAAVSLLERGGKKGAPSHRMFAVMLADYRASLDRARAALTHQEKDA